MGAFGHTWGTFVLALVRKRCGDVRLLRGNVFATFGNRKVNTIVRPNAADIVAIRLQTICCHL